MKVFARQHDGKATRERPGRAGVSYFSAFFISAILCAFAAAISSIGCYFVYSDAWSILAELTVFLVVAIAWLAACVSHEKRIGDRRTALAIINEYGWTGIIVCGVIALAFTGATDFLDGRATQELHAWYLHRSSLGGHLADYLKAPVGYSPMPEDISDNEDAYRDFVADSPTVARGKLIVCNPKTGAFDPILFMLPHSLRPSHDAEVGTIAWVERSKEVGGSYSTDGHAQPWTTPTRVYVSVWRVTLIDRQSARIIQQRVFLAPKPPAEIYEGNGTSSFHDVPPEEPVVDYLSTLVRD